MENGNEELKCINYLDMNGISYCDSCTGECWKNGLYVGERTGMFADGSFIQLNAGKIRETPDWIKGGLILIDIKPTCRAIPSKTEPLDMSGRPLFTIACLLDRNLLDRNSPNSLLTLEKLREE